MAQLWGGRFTKETDELVKQFNDSLPFDKRLYEQDIRGSVVHAAMLGKQGIITDEEAEKIIEGLGTIKADLEAGRGLTFEKKRAALLQTACKHAVKGGEPLSEDQLRSLVTEMIEHKVTPTCPHGRPLVIAISRRDLDKKFKRIQG